MGNEGSQDDSVERKASRPRARAVRRDALEALAILTRRLMSCRAVAIAAGEYRASAVDPAAELSVDPDGLVDPLTAEDLGFGFYAGVPVRAGDRDIGTVAAVDPSPREFRTEELETLKLAARVAAALVDPAEGADD